MRERIITPFQLPVFNISHVINDIVDTDMRMYYR